jgi:adenine-specific DNA glycosylase
MHYISHTFPWETLITWYRIHGRHDLEWRRYSRDELWEIDYEISGTSELLTFNSQLSYRVWLSEICLQQTQVERVRGYFRKIVEKYPTVYDLANASYEEFFPYYQWLGYYSRARNLLATAKIISEVYEGKFPREKKLLEKLPGVWAYTSSAILTFGYGEAYLAWDTNLEKVFARYYHGSRLDRLADEEKVEIEKDFRDFIRDVIVPDVSTNRWGIGGGNDVKIGDRGWASESSVATTEVFGTFDSKSTEPGLWKKNLSRAINNALMDFAATIDLKNPSNIDWETYPIKSGKFYETKWSLEPREVKKSQSFPTPDATVIVVLHKDHRIYYSSRHPEFTKDPEIPGFFLSSEWRGIKITSSYSPFILPPSLTRDTRKYVQEYFREKYSLELSVRPAHKKWISEDGVPYLVVNAQIQTGTHIFDKYTKPLAKSALEAL